MERIRIQSRELYFYYLKEIDRSGGCTNREILRERTGVDYNRLRNVFGNKRRWYYEDEKVVITRILSKDFEKGRQSLNRRGKGGMEGFMHYVMRKGY